jgi:hypothetical protein
LARIRWRQPFVQRMTVQIDFDNPCKRSTVDPGSARPLGQQFDWTPA